MPSHSREDLRTTVYRMEGMPRLIDQEFWGPDLPPVVRDVQLFQLSLHAMPRGCYDGPQPANRLLALQTPPQGGFDFRVVQLALPDAGADIKCSPCASEPNCLVR